MKYILKLSGYFILVILTVTAIVGCNENEELGISDGDENAESSMSVYICPELSESDGLAPRLIMVGDEYIATELYLPEQPDVLVFHIMNPKENLSVFMSASKHGVWFIDDNPFHPSLNPSVTVIVPDGNDYIISSGTYDTKTTEFDMTSLRRIDGEKVQTSARLGSRADDMDFARKLIVTDILDPMADRLGKVSDAIDMLKMPNTQGASFVLTVWREIGIPIAKMHLYSNNADEYQSLANDYFLTQAKKYKVVKNILDKVDQGKELYRCGLNAFLKGGEFVEDEHGDVSESFVLTTTDSYSFTSRKVQEYTWEVYDESSRYNLRIELMSVNGQTATVKGDFWGLNPGYTITGYLLYKGGQEVRREHATLDGKTPFTFGGLQKGETYVVTSYASVMGVVYESSPVYFFIEGDLELSEESLSFGQNGGSAEVGVSLPSVTWTCTATSSENWCKVSIVDNVLKVSVSSSTESRNAVVSVTAESSDGRSQSKTLVVTQTVVGNFMAFQGTCKLLTDDIFPSDPSLNYSSSQDVEQIIFLTKTGNTYYVTYALGYVGLNLINWKVSSVAPVSMLSAGYSFTSFRCTTSNNVISIKGSTKAEHVDICNFSVEINLSTLKASIIQSYKWSGDNYAGKFHKIETSITGTLNYTDKYNEAN